MTEKEFDQLFKQKLGAQRAHPFNPANWQAMEKMLDSKPANYFMFWRMTAAILGFGLLTAAALFWQNQLPQGDTGVQNPVVQSPAIEATEEATSPPSTFKTPALQQPETTEQPATESTISTNQTAPASQLATPNTTPVEAALTASNTSAAETPQSPRQAGVSLPPLSPLGMASFSPSPQSAQPLMDLPEPFEAPAPIQPVKPDVLPRFQAKHEFFVSGGPAANTSYASGQSAGWNAGLGYRYRINSRMALLAGAQYNRTGDMGLLIETDSVFFGFGRTEVNTQKHYKNIGSLRFPINFEYQLNPAHALSVGAYADVPLTVSMDMTRTTHTQKGATDVEEHSNSKQRPEFNPVNYGLQMAYFYQIYPQFSVGLQLNYGLSDLTNNAHKHFEHNHRLLQTDLTLRYRLF